MLSKLLSYLYFSTCPASVIVNRHKYSPLHSLYYIMLHKLLIDFYVIMKYKQRKNLYKYNSKIINPMRVHHLDYIIVLIIAVIAVLVLVYVENNINLSGRSIETIDDFDF